MKKNILTGCLLIVILGLILIYHIKDRNLNEYEKEELDKECIAIEDDEIERLNDYLSIFARVEQQSFEQNNVSNVDLITFGLFYNLWYNDKVDRYVTDELVSETSLNFFGKSIGKHQSIDDLVDYADNKYNISEIQMPESFGLYSEVDNILNNGDGTYTIYSTNYIEYIYDDSIHIKSYNRSIIKKVEEKYILLEYINYDK